MRSLAAPRGWVMPVSRLGAPINTTMRPQPQNKPKWWNAAMKRVKSMDTSFKEYGPDIGAAWAAMEFGLDGTMTKQKKECLEEAAILVFQEWHNQQNISKLRKESHATEN